MTDAIQIQVRPRPEAMRELRSRGAWNRRDWKTIAHVNENRIEKTRDELGVIAPESLYEYRAIRQNPPPHLHIPATLAQLGTVLDLTTESAGRRTTWEAADVGGLCMATDADAMEREPGTAALYLLRSPPQTNARKKQRCVDVEAQTPGDFRAFRRWVIDAGAAATTTPNGPLIVLDESKFAQAARAFDGLKIEDCREQNAPKARERKSGRYAHSIDRLCGCGHRLGQHDAAAAPGQRACHECHCPWFQAAKLTDKGPDLGSRKRNGKRNDEADAGATYEEWHDREPELVTTLDGLPDLIGIYVGRATRIGYRSDKWHERGTTEDYDHDYTEPGYEMPEVWADRIDLKEARAIVIVGGNQRITADGID